MHTFYAIESLHLKFAMNLKTLFGIGIVKFYFYKIFTMRIK
jgi:hypothetical protein